MLEGRRVNLLPDVFGVPLLLGKPATLILLRLKSREPRLVEETDARRCVGRLRELPACALALYPIIVPLISASTGAAVLETAALSPPWNEASAVDLIHVSICLRRYATT